MYKNYDKLIAKNGHINPKEMEVHMKKTSDPKLKEALSEFMKNHKKGRKASQFKSESKRQDLHARSRIAHSLIDFFTHHKKVLAEKTSVQDLRVIRGFMKVTRGSSTRNSCQWRSLSILQMKRKRIVDVCVCVVLSPINNLFLFIALPTLSPFSFFFSFSFFSF